jgi:hypothetical protein
MKVLHLPTNVASQISVTVRALRDIGIDARGLVLKNSPTQDDGGIECYSKFSRIKHPIRGTIHKLKWRRAILKAIRWADVVHWHGWTRTLRKDKDLQYVADLGKPRIVEFWGSDIRIPEIASADNPYAARMYQLYPKLAKDRPEKSLKSQRCFARYGFECLLPSAALEPSIQKDIFPSVFRTRQRIMLSDYEPSYPAPKKQRPLIVHTPSNKAKKGTEAVLQTINQLKDRYEFDFKLIHRTERCRVLEIMRNCDIMLDQFTLGAHGVAALEAMAFGKPTLCYIKPSFVGRYPNDLPIINANQGNLTEVLSDLLEDGQKRYEIGCRSRAYIEKHHDAHRIARDLAGIYRELLEKA